jgi:type II secretory ATPase GspE/PulE/Tfp pilus assembly ATPase PilB-like protein
LLRRLCTACKQPYAPDDAQRRLAGAPPTGELTLYRAVGCDVCSHIGYKGRIGTHEMLVPNDHFRKAITTKGMTTEALKRQAVEDCGMTTLYWDAMEKVRAGICALEDVLSEVRKDEFDARPAWMFEELGLERPAIRDHPPL